MCEGVCVRVCERGVCEGVCERGVCEGMLQAPTNTTYCV